MKLICRVAEASHTSSCVYYPATKTTLYWSAELFRIFGLDSQQRPPTFGETRRLVHPDDLEWVSESCLKAFRDKAEFTQEYRVVLHDNTVKHLDVIWRPVLDQDGELVEYVGTAADVTGRKRAEEEREKLRQLEAELAHINRIQHDGRVGGIARSRAQAAHRRGSH